MLSDRIKTPTILQMEVAECGAAALAIMLGYYGRYIPLEQMRVDCGVSRDGSNAVMILEAARKHGLIAHAAKVDGLEDLAQLKPPVILFWEFNHYVVWEGTKNGKVYINDPATGPRTIDLATFNHAFTGVVLVASPGPKFEKIGSPTTLFGALKKQIKGAERDLGFVLLASLCLVIPTLLFVAYTKVFIDNILIEKNGNWIYPFFTAFSLTIVVTGILLWLESYYLLRLKIKLLLANSITFLWHVLRLPVYFFQQRFAGDINERVTANDRIANLLSNDLTLALVSLFSLFVYAIVLLLMNWKLAIIAFFALGLNLVSYGLIARAFADLNRNFLQKNGKLQGFIMYGLYLIEDLKANGREDDFFQRWAGLHADLISVQQKQANYTQVLTIVPSLFQFLTLTIVLGYGSWQIMNGVMTIGMLVSFQLLLQQFSTPIQALVSLGGELQKIKGDLSRLDDVRQNEIDPRFLISTREDNLDSSIQIEDLSFSYNPTYPIIKDLNLNIASNETFALIGKSGQGKSTIAKLIAGLYQPQKGTIKIGGLPLNEIDSASLAKILGYVAQDIFLYHGTMRENISFWKADLSDEAIEQALKDALIFDLIRDRGGLDCLVLENGTNFSTGQRQRIEIARVLAQNPQILILDEATANLDAETERGVLTNIKKRGCTTMIITHRLGALTDCNKIYSLENGIVTNLKELP